MLAEAFELKIEAQEIFGEGDKVVVRQRVAGRHVGPFMGIAATGRRWQIEEVVIAEFRGPKIARMWRLVDMLSLMRQLGVVVAPGD